MTCRPSQTHKPAYWLDNRTQSFVCLWLLSKAQVADSRKIFRLGKFLNEYLQLRRLYGEMLEGVYKSPSTATDGRGRIQVRRWSWGTRL